jgi:glycerol 3-phosphatase-2
LDRRGFAAGARPADYDGLILDLDGVVWLNGDPLDGAAGAIARLRASGKRVVFLTNDTRSTKSAHAARLVTIGIPATAADVITAAAATARFLRSRREFANQGVFVVGSPALRDEIGEIGLRIVSAAEARQAKAVVVGCHPGFDYAELRAATAAITNGATLVAAGRDAVFPTPDGSWPATGAIVAAIEAAAGVRAIVVGKPEPFMFQTACEALDGCRRIAVIGDHPVSDIAGARGAGLDAILVLTGVASRPDLEQAPVAPDLVFDSLAAFADAAC